MVLEAPAAPASGLLFDSAGYDKYETKYRQRLDLRRERVVTSAHVDTSLADLSPGGTVDAAEVCSPSLSLSLSLSLALRLP
jgi:hypothetical protein